MAMSLAPILVGIFVILLGISNMKGNISSVHHYHRKRVKEIDRIPFGKKIGLGSIIIGVSLILSGAFSYAANAMQNGLLMRAGNIVMIIGFTVGIIISLQAINKYNGGLF
ncbi:MAG: hypothetical protein IIY16_05855 [Oscillospiraceae bacterium]|nr:hypothetical protein [Oscillospiraceae bacterium]